MSLKIKNQNDKVAKPEFEQNASSIFVWVDGNMVEMDYKKFDSFQINAIADNALFSNEISGVTVYSIGYPLQSIKSKVIVKQLTSPIKKAKAANRDQVRRISIKNVTEKGSAKTPAQIEAEQAERYSNFIDQIVASENEETEMMKWSLGRFAQE